MLLTLLMMIIVLIVLPLKVNVDVNVITDSTHNATFPDVDGTTTFNNSPILTT